MLLMEFMDLPFTGVKSTLPFTGVSSHGGEGSSLALVGNPSRDGFSIKNTGVEAP